MNGNHGRFFVMTTDGFYLDEMFKDVRVTQIADAYLIGGECFGGYFNKAEDGRYYLQSGHTDYRVFEIGGLDQLVRAAGTVTVTRRRSSAAQGQQRNRRSDEAAAQVHVRGRARARQEAARLAVRTGRARGASRGAIPTSPIPTCRSRPCGPTIASISPIA